MRILIVDDHPIMRVGVRQLILQEWPDAEVPEAPTLADALSLVQRQPPDAVVLDLSLPDASGVESATRMLHALKNTPILVLSLNAEAAMPRA